MRRSNRWGAIVSLTTVLLVTSCRSNKTADEPPYTPEEGAVGFDAQLVKGPADFSGPTQWLATHRSNGRTAQFRIELGGPTTDSAAAGIRIRFGKGRFISVAGSDATMLLPELQKALEAKRVLVKAVRASSLPFEYAIIGEGLHRESTVGTTGVRNWFSIKLFLGDDEGEVFLNLNPVLKKGEFSIKDSDYGDYVVGELAKVL